MKKGFTLIELLVAMAIISGLGIMIAQAFFTTTRSNTKVEKLTDVKQNGDYALSVMERMIRNARVLTAVCTDDGSTPVSSVAIENPDGGTTTLQCLLSDSVTRIASVSSFGTEYLTSNAVSLGGSTCDGDSFTFYCTSVAQVSKTLKINFSLSQKGTPTDQFEKASTQFQTSVGLRSQ